MKTLMILILLLPGCASYNAVTGIVRGQGAEVADKEMDASLFLLCKGITVGAWMRRFGDSQHLADAWGVLCSNKSIAPPVTP